MSERWTVGDMLNDRAIYKDGQFVGVLDTPEVARELVYAINAIPGLANEASKTVELRLLLRRWLAWNDPPDEVEQEDHKKWSQLQSDTEKLLKGEPLGALTYEKCGYDLGGIFGECGCKRFCTVQKDHQCPHQCTPHVCPHAAWKPSGLYYPIADREGRVVEMRHGERPKLGDIVKNGGIDHVVAKCKDPGKQCLACDRLGYHLEPVKKLWGVYVPNQPPGGEWCTGVDGKRLETDEIAARTLAKLWIRQTFVGEYLPFEARELP